MECETLLQYKWRMDLICRRVGQWRQPAPSSSSSRSNTVAAVQHIWTRCCVVWLLDAASKARVQKFAPGHRIQRSDWPIIGNISWLMFVICGTKPNKKKSAQRTTSYVHACIVVAGVVQNWTQSKGKPDCQVACLPHYILRMLVSCDVMDAIANQQRRESSPAVCVCELRVTVTKWCLHVAPGDVDALRECRGNFFGACRNSLACKR